jgi:hypothetical protein
MAVIPFPRPPSESAPSRASPANTAEASAPELRRVEAFLEHALRTAERLSADEARQETTLRVSVPLALVAAAFTCGLLAVLLGGWGVIIGLSLAATVTLAVRQLRAERLPPQERVHEMDRVALREGLDRLLREAVRSRDFAVALQANPRYRILATLVSCRFGVPRLHADLPTAYHTFETNRHGDRVPVGRSLYDERDVAGW